MLWFLFYIFLPAHSEQLYRAKQRPKDSRAYNNQVTQLKHVKSCKEQNLHVKHFFLKSPPCKTYLNGSTLEGFICLDSFNLLLWGFISTEAWMHGDIFISGQWGFDIDLTCKTHCNEQQRSRLSLYWHNRSLPNCPHYWPVISFIRPVPSGPNLGLPPPACGVCEEHRTQCGHPLSAGQQNKAGHLHHWLRVLVFIFHSA